MQPQRRNVVDTVQGCFYIPFFLIGAFPCALPVCLTQVGDALIAINNVGVQGWRFNEIMHKMKKSLRQDPCIVLRFRTMEERYRLLRMKVCTARRYGYLPPLSPIYGQTYSRRS